MAFPSSSSSSSSTRWGFHVDQFFAEEAKSLFLDPEGSIGEVVSLLQALIRNACVNDGKDCNEELNINVLKEYFDKNGIVYETHARPDAPHRPNLIATYGSGSPRVMLGPAHVDVVPVQSVRHTDGTEQFPGWTHPPFSGAYEDGHIFGRGAVDMLNIVATQAVAFVSIVRQKIPLQGTLLFCAVSDEEAKGAYGVGWFLQHVELSKVFAADYTVTEVGGATLPDKHGQPTKNYMMASGEKGSVTVTITAKGKSGHGSLPANADNALIRMSNIVQRIANYEPPTVVTPEWISFVNALDISTVKKWLLTSATTLPFIRKQLLSAKNPLGPLADASTKLTMSPNHLTGTVKSNVIPGTASVEIDCRLLPGMDLEYVKQQIRAAVGDEIYTDHSHYDIDFGEYMPASRSDPNNPFWKAIEKSCHQIVHSSTVLPCLLVGATDNRFYRVHGNAISYGAALFSPDTTFGTVMSRFHGVDEKISVESLWTSLQFYALTAINMMSDHS
eukprot:GILJ01006043.1.p1 GENE.GILJ01006043.1~~GILJ01006043.1.p1  ORF type:complete len:501 (+),score=75.26 GILJ01006043.1:50-1552(+)